MQYPYLSRIEAALEAKSETKLWLSNALGISPRTLYNKRNITDETLADISKISKILDFNFIEDYNSWQIEHGGELISVVGEPPTYYKPEKKVSIPLTLTGPASAFKDFDKIINIIADAGEKHGFEIG